MKRDETIQILMLVQAAYPNYKPHDKTVTVNLWNKMLSDYEYNQVCAAVEAYILTGNGFPPSIGDIVDKLQMVFGEAEYSDVEAWELVWKAISNSGYHAEEEFEKLPEIAKKVVGSPGQLRQWALSEVRDDTISVWRSNFLKQYRTESQRKKERDKLSPNLKKLIYEKETEKRITSSDVKQIESKPTQENGVEMPDSVKERFRKLLQEGKE